MVDAPLASHYPLTVIGREWCFDTPVTLRTRYSEWLRTLWVKNQATGERLVTIKHSLSAVIEINTAVESSAIFEVTAPATKSQLLTVERETKGRRYGVHNGIFRHEDGHQPSLFSVNVHEDDRERLRFRDATTGAAYEAEVDGTFRETTGVVRVSRDGGVSWEPIARINHPKRKLLRSEYYTIEVAAGVDVLLVTMIWLARWAEFQRSKPQLKSYSLYPTWNPN